MFNKIIVFLILLYTPVGYSQDINTIGREFLKGSSVLNQKALPTYKNRGFTGPLKHVSCFAKINQPATSHTVYFNDHDNTDIKDKRAISKYIEQFKNTSDEIIASFKLSGYADTCGVENSNQRKKDNLVLSEKRNASVENHIYSLGKLIGKISKKAAFGDSHSSGHSEHDLKTEIKPTSPPVLYIIDGSGSLSEQMVDSNGNRVTRYQNIIRNYNFLPNSMIYITREYFKGESKRRDPRNKNKLIHPCSELRNGIASYKPRGTNYTWSSLNNVLTEIDFNQYPDLRIVVLSDMPLQGEDVSRYGRCQQCSTKDSVLRKIYSNQHLKLHKNITFESYIPNKQKFMKFNPNW